MGLGLSVFPTDISMGQVFFLFSKNGHILPEKPSSRLLNGEKDMSHPCDSLPERGSYLGPPLLPLKPLCSSQGGKDIADAKYRGSSKPSQHGRRWIPLSRGREENPSPCSSTIQWDLSCSCSQLCLYQKLCLLSLSVGFSKCIWSEQKKQAIQRDGNPYQGMTVQQDAGEVCPTSEQVGKYLKHMRNIARRKSWGPGSGVWDLLLWSSDKFTFSPQC